MFNHYLCEVCKPAWDMARGVPTQDSELFQVEVHEEKTKLVYRQNTRTLQQSSDEGCFVCKFVLEETYASNSQFYVPSENPSDRLSDTSGDNPSNNPANDHFNDPINDPFTNPCDERDDDQSDDWTDDSSNDKSDGRCNDLAADQSNDDSNGVFNGSNSDVSGESSDNVPSEPSDCRFFHLSTSGFDEALLGLYSIGERVKDREKCAMNSYIFMKNMAGNLVVFGWSIQTPSRIGSEFDNSYGYLTSYRRPKNSDEAQAFGSPFEKSQGKLNDDVLAEYRPTADMMSEPLWELIEAWIGQCGTTHQCWNASRSTPVEFPSRLVQLNTSGSPFRARVVATAASDFVKSPYLTLSHRWGSSRFITLTSSNPDIWHEEIPLDQLTDTFLDAFRITQKLGFRYIWIDSLCIIQEGEDAENDWRSESARMGDIYRGSFLNIAAATPSAGGSLLESDRASESIFPYLQYTEVDSGVECRWFDPAMWAKEVNKTSLNQRAWVMQERLLAPRVVYFGGKQVCWECSELTACETIPNDFREALPKAFAAEFGPDLKTWRSKTENSRISSRSRQGGGEQISQSTNEYRLWEAIVEAYSAAGLTKDRDRLIALSGIAKHMQNTLKDEYLAGLWKRNLLRGLLWQVADVSHRLECYRAPSWSWASLGTAICWPRKHEQLKEFAKVLDVLTQPVASDRTGELAGGHIVLAGVVLRQIPVLFTGLDCLEPCIDEMECYFDEEDYDRTTVDCVLLGQMWRLSDVWIGLLLRKVGQDPHVFERTGVFEVPCGRFDLPSAMNSSGHRVNVSELPVVFDKLRRHIAKFDPVGRINAEERIEETMEVFEQLRKCVKPFREVITIV